MKSIERTLIAVLVTMLLLAAASGALIAPSHSSGIAGPAPTSHL